MKTGDEQVAHPEILGRAVGQAPEMASERSTTTPSISVTVPYTSGATGSARAELFVSNDDEDRGGCILRLTIDDGGSSFAPLAKNFGNGVDLHLAGEAEGAAFLSAISGLLASFHTSAIKPGVGV